MEKEKRDEIIRKQSEEMEESTRRMRAERSKANRRWLEEARAREAKRRANISAKGPTSGTPNAGTAAEVQRIREAVERGCDFLSTDQEARITEAAVGLPVEPVALIYSADGRAKQLCQENPSVELTLILATIEEIVQSLIRELTEERRRNEAAMSGGENLSKDSVNIASVDMSIDQSTSSRASLQFKRPPPPRGRALRHAAPEIDQTHGYIADVAAALRQAIEVRDEKLIKSYRRSLRSAMVRMKEVATRTVQSQKWDPSLVAEFMQDVDGSTSELLKNANAALMQLDQKTLTTWANDCAEQGRQVMHLAAEAYELLTPDAWTLEDCDEYMTELDEELKRLKDLFKLFSTDRLNLAMRREAAKLTNNVNTEVTKARKIVQRLITIHEAGRGPRWGSTGRPRRHIRAREGQHVEGPSGTGGKEPPISRERGGPAVQIRGRAMRGTGTGRVNG